MGSFDGVLDIHGASYMSKMVGMRSVAGQNIFPGNGDSDSDHIYLTSELEIKNIVMAYQQN